MIEFLRLINKIKIGSYLHLKGNIDDNLSDDVIGICVVPNNFFHDKLARFMTTYRAVSSWGRGIRLMEGDSEYKRKLPGLSGGIPFGYFSSPLKSFQLVSPSLPGGSLNSDYLKDINDGNNAFQDYKGYENIKIYKERYGELESFDIFRTCSKISPPYRKSEWYVPAIGELALLLKNKPLIQRKLGIISGTNIFRDTTSHARIWSSSEHSIIHSWYIEMDFGYVNYCNKDNISYLHAFLAL